MVLQACIDVLAAQIPQLRRSAGPIKIDDGGALFAGLGKEFDASCLIDREARVLLTAQGARRYEEGEEGELGVDILKAGVAMVDMLELNDEIEDILITTREGIQVLRPLDPTAALFVHVKIDRRQGNMPMARKRAELAEAAFV